MTPSPAMAMAMAEPAPERRVTLPIVKRYAAMLEKIGRPVRGVRIAPDGTVTLLTDADNLSSSEQDDELERWRAKHARR